LSATAASRRDDNTGTNAIDEAALWLATGGADKAHAILPQIRKHFGLTAAEAVLAIRGSNLIKARAS
jgi:hypothetical protein